MFSTFPESQDLAISTNISQYLPHIFHHHGFFMIFPTFLLNFSSVVFHVKPPGFVVDFRQLQLQQERRASRFGGPQREVPRVRREDPAEPRGEHLGSQRGAVPRPWLRMVSRELNSGGENRQKLVAFLGKINNWSNLGEHLEYFHESRHKICLPRGSLKFAVW